ncbi:MAG TPA: transporter [Firmicutes bacterium]|nr:transporter [Bacillota bacterium]
MGFDQILGEVLSTLTPYNIFMIFIGTFLGIVVGALPGLTTTMGVALLTGMTYRFSGEAAIALLVGIYVGGVSGGSLSAILIGIPGTPANASTTMDGFPLALEGKASHAIMVARSASIIGTMFGIMCLAFFTPVLSDLSLQFTSAEFFMLGLFGVLTSGTMSGTDYPIKGWIAGIFGLAVGLIGTDELCGYQRLCFGSFELIGGIPFVPIMIGFFAIPQIVNSLIAEQDVLVAKLEKTKVKLSEIFRHTLVALRSGLIGVGIGVIPGVGEDVASWVSYGVAKRTSKKPEEYGKGSYEGLIAAETADNACIGGALIPLLSLGIPGSPPAAILLGAFMLHGVQPGPMLTFQHPAFLYQVVSWLVVATVFMWGISIMIAKPMSKILQIKNAITMPVIAVLCAIGSYALDLRFLDIVLVFIAGLFGLLLNQGKYPPAPLVLGIILGPLVDTSFRRALQASHGDISIFVTRPVSLVLFLAIIGLILGQLGVFGKIKQRFQRKNAAV